MGATDFNTCPTPGPSDTKSLDLDTVERSLAAHFQQLAASRHAGGVKHPVFALEHGLRDEERKALGEELKKWIANRPPATTHRLAWTVYATEIGYNFTGAEYWQTFEEKTPGWWRWDARSWIRDCFLHFKRTYGGIHPQGAWAEHFSIICWPITHAILPVDLQYDLARILYGLRHQFSAEFFSSPAQIGRQIHARSWDATPRFRYLTEDHALVGQIAMALLLSETELGTSLIHPETLRRVASDLERHRISREWLRKARNAAKDRRKIKGLGANSSPISGTAAPNRLQAARQLVAKLGLEPKLLVRPVDVAGGKWRVFLEIPNLSQLLDRFPAAKELLTSTRCAVTGSNERPLARGRVLSGVQTVQLARWPRHDEVLLKFEQCDAEIEFLLRTECLLRPGNTWLFEVAVDGTAIERKTPRIRTGERYLLLRENVPFATGTMVTPVGIECTGIHGALLVVPASLSMVAQQELRALGVAATKSLEVWPAGLTAAWWDGVGHAEWLAGEQPCVAIQPDHEVRRIDVSLVGTDQKASLVVPTPDRPVFLQLPDLPLGQHTLHVATEESEQNGEGNFGSLEFTFRVRESLPQDRQTHNGAIELELEPSSPALEDLWDGKLKLTLKGPLRRMVKCGVTLVPHDSAALPFKKTLNGMQFPLTPERFQREFEKHFRSNTQLEKKYDAAKACLLEFDAGQFGRIAITCERAFTALRWVVTRQSNGYGLNLLNDTGSAVPPEITWITFERPTTELKWTATLPSDAPKDGGLFIAKVDKAVAAFVVPPVVTNLHDIVGRIVAEHASRTPAYLTRLLQVYRLWSDAKLSGNFASTLRRKNVLQWLRLQIVAVLCGEPWRAIEASARTHLVQDLNSALARRPPDEYLARAILVHAKRLAVQPCSDRVEFLRQLAQRNPRMAPTWLNDREVRQLCEFACRLLSRPESLPITPSNDFASMAKRLVDEVPTLCRAARLLIHATEPNPNDPETAFPNWQDL